MLRSEITSDAGHNAHSSDHHRAVQQARRSRVALVVTGVVHSFHARVSVVERCRRVMGAGLSSFASRPAHSLGATRSDGFVQSLSFEIVLGLARSTFVRCATGGQWSAQRCTLIDASNPRGLASGHSCWQSVGRSESRVASQVAIALTDLIDVSERWRFS